MEEKNYADQTDAYQRFTDALEKLQDGFWRTINETFTSAVRDAMVEILESQRPDFWFPCEEKIGWLEASIGGRIIDGFAIMRMSLEGLPDNLLDHILHRGEPYETDYLTAWAKFLEKQAAEIRRIIKEKDR